MTRGAWTRLISRYATNGFTSTGPSIKRGAPPDFLLSRRRDMAAAKRFFSKATKQHGAPRVITLDSYAASHRAVDKLKISGILPRRVQVRSCKYLNRARSPANKATGQADARVQAIREGSRDDSRHRVSGENQETTIQPQTTNRTSNHRSGNLDCGLGRLKSTKSSRQTNTYT